jgi:ATP-dependent DNA ligase
VKYDGYRLPVERIALKVRLMTRGGYDWTRRYPPASRMPDGFNTEVDKTGWRH